MRVLPRSLHLAGPSISPNQPEEAEVESDDFASKIGKSVRSFGLAAPMKMSRKCILNSRRGTFRDASIGHSRTSKWQPFLVKNSALSIHFSERTYAMILLEI